jgi:hypothetical protein
MLLAALKNKRIELQHDLTEEEGQAVVKTQIKQLKDSIESFRTGGREAMAKAAEAEVGFLIQYLPAQLSDEELTKIVKEAVTTAGAQSQADTGKAMGAAMKAVAGRAEGGRVKAIIETLLPVLVLGILVLVSPVLAATAPGKAEAQTFLLPVLKAGRIFLILAAIVGINTILVGGFTVMTAGGRDDVQMTGFQKITQGMMTVFVITLIFAVLSIVIGKMG